MQNSIAGSWFSSGFHGNSRSKPRNDIMQQYRHEAQPQPPLLFLQRLKEDPKKHLFTKHQNEQGIPRTVRNMNTGIVTPVSTKRPRRPYNLLGWAPLEEELIRQRPPITTYQCDFWKFDDCTRDKKIPQLLVPRLSVGKPPDRTPSTIYQHTFKKHPSRLRDSLSRPAQPESPPKDDSCATDAEKPLASPDANTRVLSAPLSRVTVSDCLAWPTSVVDKASYLPPA
ncbi:uncharacterized protein C3orf84 homolog [Ambystoma mexicanum]|uniref:uncharacterized protein C3orf84 homolog n=1 Tax=Ambystoma mexicanum TaxID=8296 RepID=UPI0037E93079